MTTLYSITTLAHTTDAAHADATQLTLTALWVTAVLTAVIHTLAGPDHYLPFIAIAKARAYSLGKTLIFTALCGMGHIASALLLALGFIYLSNLLTEANLTIIEDHRGEVAAYLLIGLGTAYLVWALHKRFVHDVTPHTHPHEVPAGKSITPWIIFIIFILGPCEALLPILTSASVLGTTAVVSSSLIFSCITIASMLLCVTVGILGINHLRLHFIERNAHEIAGITIMLCGVAIICGL